jgi:hypothetical protein
LLLRFTNDAVHSRTDRVVANIREEMRKRADVLGTGPHPPTPSPRGEGEW